MHRGSIQALRYVTRTPKACMVVSAYCTYHIYIYIYIYKARIIRSTTIQVWMVLTVAYV